MEVKIGVQYAHRELVLDSNQSSAEIEKTVADALAAGGTLTLEDEKGRRVLVPVDKITYIEIAESAPRAVGFTAPGATAKMKVLREKAERTIDVKVGEAADEREVAARPGQRGPSSLGMEIRPVTPEVARQLNLRNAEGVVVVRVDDESPAATAGVQRGDVIREINRQRIRTVGDFEKATKDLKDGDRMTVLLQRGPMSLYVAFTVGRG